ncbi:MFS general substrate transporter [Coniochaeta hoffmannii]|uniref:MFS general substrate transporter n=1 Tax=Coniochaeta hoffmannii TaxID=91930 RepID=A0AA38W1W1_9PEZI|nr:MFS general substrate transporter [Coniochaeta hoffmannii]
MTDPEKQPVAAAASDRANERTVTASPPVETEKLTQHVQSKEVDHASQEYLEPVPHVHLRTYLAVLAVCLIYFAQDFALVGAGSQGQVIASTFGRTQDASWITATIAILTVVLGPIVSQASDYWGRKWFLVILTLIGATGAVIVSRANSMNMVIAGFAVIGIDFGVQPLLHTVASEVLPRRWRAWGQASVMVFNALALITGLIVGGHFNRRGDPNGFRYFFYIAAAFFALAAAICVYAYRPLPRPLQTAYTFNEKVAKLDWVGYALLSSSLVLFCVGLSYSQNPYEWSDPRVSATFAIGIALGFVLIAYEWKFKTDGMFHHGLFEKNRNFSIALLCVFCEGMAFFAVNIYFAFQVSVLYETDFLLVTTCFSIAFVACLVGSVVTGIYCSKTKKVRWMTFSAFCIFVGFFIGMAATNKSTSNAAWGLPVLMGFGLGMTLVTLITAAQLSIPAELVSVATGLIISVRSLGGTIGIAIYNAVFISAMKHLPDNIASAAISAGLPFSSVQQFVGDLAGQNQTDLVNVPGITPEIIGAGAGALLDTYATGFRNVWVTAIAFCVLAGISSVFLFDPSKEFNNHIDAPVEKDEDLYNSC